MSIVILLAAWKCQKPAVSIRCVGTQVMAMPKEEAGSAIRAYSRPVASGNVLRACGSLFSNLRQSHSWRPAVSFLRSRRVERERSGPVSM